MCKKPGLDSDIPPLKARKKTIYELNIHETTVIEWGKQTVQTDLGPRVIPCFSRVMRVEGGWIYNCDSDHAVFVPMIKEGEPDKSVEAPPLDYVNESYDPLWEPRNTPPMPRCKEAKTSVTEGKMRSGSGLKVPEPPPPPVRELNEDIGIGFIKMVKGWFKK